MSALDGLALLLRVGISLAVVLGLMWGAAALLRRGGLTNGMRRRGAPIEVLARQHLGRKASIAIVRAGGRGLVLGVTDANVSVLAETDPAELEPLLPTPGTAPGPGAQEEAPGTPAWKVFLDAVRDRTVRRT